MRLMAKMQLSFVRIMLAGGLLFAGSLASQAESNSYELRQNQLTSRRTGVDVRTIEQRQQRRDYQNQQQWYREDERRTATQPMQLRVPTMRPTCPLPINGNLNPGARCR
jgi:hypothetical protein